MDEMLSLSLLPTVQSELIRKAVSVATFLHHQSQVQDKHGMGCYFGDQSVGGSRLTRPPGMTNTLQCRFLKLPFLGDRTVQ